MMKNLVKLSGAAVVFLSVFLAAPIKASGQSNWLTKVTLGEVANGEPGLAEFKGPDGVDRLILTWGGSGNNYFNSLVSTDGVNWTNKYTLRSSPLVAYDVTGGIGMTGSTSCGYAYAAFRDGASGLGRSSSYYGHIWVARTQNGSTWSSFYNVTPTWSSWSAPSLRGDNSSLPIGAAFAHYYGATGTYYSWKEKFNCDLSGPALVENEQPSGGSGCFFTSCGYDMAGGWTPLWTGANGTTNLQGIGTGSFNDAGLIFYQVNAGSILQIGTNWANNGLGGAVNPSNNTPYVAWTCDYVDAGTCHQGGNINLYNTVSLASLCECSDFSDFKPAVVFWKGKIVVAWAGYNNHYINIGTLNPF